MLSGWLSVYGRISSFPLYTGVLYPVKSQSRIPAPYKGQIISTIVFHGKKSCTPLNCYPVEKKSFNSPIKPFR